MGEMAYAWAMERIRELEATVTEEREERAKAVLARAAAEAENVRLNEEIQRLLKCQK